MVCEALGPGNHSFASGSFSLQIISQKDEHCWVGELNGLRGEAGHSLLHPFWPLPLTRNLAEPVLSPIGGRGG